jgi:hypothetical protein
MNLWETIGLDWFLLAFAVTVGVLSYDATLFARGLETISDHIWDHLIAWRDSGYKLMQFPLLTVLLPFGVSQQAVGLFVHLIAGLIKRQVS